MAAAKAAEADAVIGFGGGSAMDLAKLVAVLVTSDQRLPDISGPNRAPKRTVALAQIPTTAGTGSEVGTRALITDPTTMNKIATESVEMLADIAIIDPGLTVSVPPMVTGRHRRRRHGALRRGLHLEARPSDHRRLRAAGHRARRPLPRAARSRTAPTSRPAPAFALAAFYGGVCLGPVNTTAGHASPIRSAPATGSRTGIANALIFPHVLAVNAPAVPERPRSSGGPSASAPRGGSRCSAGRATSARGSGSTWRCAPRRAARRPAGLGQGGARDPAAARLEPRRPLRGRHPRNLRSGLLRPGETHDQGSLRRPRHLLQRRRDRQLRRHPRPGAPPGRGRQQHHVRRHQRRLHRAHLRREGAASAARWSTRWAARPR